MRAPFPHAAIFTGLFLAFIAAPLPMDFALRALGLAPTGRAALSEVPRVTWREIMNGSAGQRWEKTLTGRSFLAQEIGARYSEAVLLTHVRTPKGVAIGRDGWLFNDFSVLRRTRRESEHRARTATAVIAAHVKAIEAAGVPVLVTIVPDRGRLYADKAYFDGRLPETRQYFHDLFFGLMAAAGVETLDLLPALTDARQQGVSVFYRDDPHWTFRGAEIAAGAAAARIARDYPPPTGARMRHAPFAVDWFAYPEHAGSILTNLQVPRDGRIAARYADPEPRAHFPPNPARDAGDFAVGAGPGVLLLDTSYGVFGFPEFLANALGERVDAIIGEGRGPVYAPNVLISGVLDQPRARRPRLVVWNIPEYLLYEMVEDQQEILPAYRPGDFVGMPFTLVAGAGARQIAADTLQVRQRESTFVLQTATPLRRIRIVMAVSPGYGEKWISMPDAATDRYDVADMLGSERYSETAYPEKLPDAPGVAAYDFTLPQPRRAFSLKLFFRSADDTVRVIGVQDLDQPVQSTAAAEPSQPPSAR